MSRASIIIFIITNQCTVNIITVYSTTVYNLYFYMFRLFHDIIREYFVCASLSYTCFPNCCCWHYFIKSRFLFFSLLNNANSCNLENLCDLTRYRCNTPWWWHEMSKHERVYIIHCCDIYCYDINCALVGYNKNRNCSTLLCSITVLCVTSHFVCISVRFSTTARIRISNGPYIR